MTLPQTEAPTTRATARFVRVTPMKARRVVDMIRYKPANEALAMLRFAPQAASEPVAKVLASAMANAEHNLKVEQDSLVISAAYVDGGPTLKRFRPRARGRAFPINKRTSHITIEVSSIAVEEAPRRSRRNSGASKSATSTSSSKGRTR